MCRCTPGLRTPFCGKPDCHPPPAQNPFWAPSNDNECAPVNQRAQAKRITAQGLVRDLFASAVAAQRDGRPLSIVAAMAAWEPLILRHLDAYDQRG